jgi:hypothetical protein
MFVCVERFFEDIRQMETDVKLTGNELLIILRDILKDSYLEIIEQADAARLARPAPSSQTAQDEQQREFAKLRESLQSDLSLRNYSHFDARGVGQ